MTKPNRMTPEAEQELISQLFNEHNGDKKTMVAALNDLGAQTRKGKSWSVQAVVAAIKRNRYISPSVTKSTPITSQDEETTDPGAEEDSQGGITNELAEDYHPEQDASVDEQEDVGSDAITNDLPGGSQSLEPEVIELLNEAHAVGHLQQVLELAESGALAGMARWWQDHKGIAMQQTARPLFKDDRKNTGIFVNREVLNRAKDRMSREKATVGKSVSQLCEFLLWKYIDSPEDVLEKPETKDSE